MSSSEGKTIELARDSVEFQGFRRRIIWQSSDIVIEQIAGSVDRPFTSYVDIPHNLGSIAIVEAGSTLVRGESASSWGFVPPNCVSVSRGPKRVIMKLSKGDHAATVIGWDLSASPAIAQSFESMLVGRNGRDSGYGLPARTSKPHFDLASTRLQSALSNPNPAVSSALVWSVIAEAVAYVGESDSESVLAPTPADLPSNLKSLVEFVRLHPDRPWPLKDGADFVEYSPFHFSRVFKQLVGFGFHEFVDRVRCETGVRLLCDTEDPIDMVASLSGYTNSQGLRDALKEYVGLAPKDFRSDPHHSLIR